MSLHPGTTNTDLSTPFQKNVAAEKLFTVEYSVSRMLEVVNEAQISTHNGKFFAYDGTEIEW